MIKNSPARSAPHPRTTRVDTRFRHHTARPPLSLGHIGACPPPSASAHAPRPAVPSADNVTTFLPRGWGWSSGLLNSQSICFTSYATSSLTGHTLIGIKIYLNFPHKVPTHSRTVGPAQPYKRVSKCYFLYGSGPRGCKLLLQSCPTVTLWTVAHQAPLSIRFSRQEYWGGFLCPPPGDLPDPGIKLTSLMSPALAGRFFATSATWEAPPEDGRRLSHFLFPAPRMELWLGTDDIS